MIIKMVFLRPIWRILCCSALLMAAIASPGIAQQSKPNILLLVADDVGYWNVSHNNRGMMGYKTPRRHSTLATTRRGLLQLLA